MVLGSAEGYATGSRSFHTSLSLALERLRLTVISEFEVAIRESSRAHVTTDPVHGKVSEAVRGSRSPPSLGSPKDYDQDFLLSIEDSLMLDDSFTAKESLTDRYLPSGNFLHLGDDAEIRQLGRRNRKKFVTMEDLPISNSTSSVKISLAKSSYKSSRSGSVDSDRKIMSIGQTMPVHSSYNLVSPLGREHGMSSRTSEAPRSINYPVDSDMCDSIEYEIEQQYLVISPFWAKLYEAGLHNNVLVGIGDEMRMVESMQKDLSRIGTSRYSPDGDERFFRRTHVSSYAARSPAWIVEKLRMDDEESRCFKFLSPLILSPDAKFSVFWSFLCLALLVIDGVMIPINECFRRRETRIMQIMQWIFQCFWSCDILVSFLSAYFYDGRLEKSPGAIAERYLKSFFLFDVVLVSTEWIILCVGDLSGGSAISLLRNFKAFRMARMIRYLRFARFWKMLPFIKRFLVLSSQGVGASMLLFSVVLACILLAHNGACLWYLVGDSIEGGWVSANGLEDHSIARKYVICLHYMFIRLVGSSSHLVYVHETPELVFDTLILFISLLLTSVLLSVVAQALVVWIRSDVAQVKKLAVVFLKRHQIDPETRTRVHNYLQANQMHGPGEMLMGETKFLRALPINLQEELLFESRRVVVCRVSVLSIIVGFSSRFVRAICQKAVSDILAVEGELIFHKGDENLGEAYFLRMGKLWYTCDEDVLQETPRSSSCPRDMKDFGSDWVRRGAVISEVALFVNHWQHVGDLVPEKDSILLVLNVQKFAEIVESYRIASICALKYARHFVWSLNRTASCDLSGFDFTVERLDEEFFTGTAEDHFAFISHYKLEAGTEATLLRDLMEQKIREDPSNSFADFLSPVFVDSEDLVDLATLEQHVTGSHNLILLLTPGILTRPWCLLEIATALQNEVQLVPVEIQRPGLAYEYPDDEWYKRFRDGKILAPADEELLLKEGHSLEKVGEALRQVFKKISLPFSPHKSGNVRKAEILDIMKRCSGGDIGAAFTTTRSSFGPDSRTNSNVPSDSRTNSNVPSIAKQRRSKHRITITRNNAFLLGGAVSTEQH